MDIREQHPTLIKHGPSINHINYHELVKCSTLIRLNQASPLQ